MASFLVLYGTGEGQTATVANRIVEGRPGVVPPKSGAGTDEP